EPSGPVAKPRARADEVERGAVSAGELARGRTELARVDRGDRCRELGLELRRLRRLVTRCYQLVWPLKKLVDDLDLVDTAAEARERVDEALESVVALDDLGGTLLLVPVCLVVDDQRPRPGQLEDVEPPVQEDAVVLERERPLGGRALETRHACGELRAAVGDNEVADPIDFLLGDGRIPGPHELGEVAR